MTRIIRTAARHPGWVLLLLALLTLMAVVHIPDLRVEITAEGMVVNDPPAIELYERTISTFGSESVTVVYIEDADIAEPENLRIIRQALTTIEAIPQVSRTVSLFSIRYLRTVDGYIYTNPYLKSIPATREAADAVMQAALLNPLIERNLLSSDGSVMAINIYFDVNNHHRGSDEQVAKALDQAIAPLKQRFRRVFHMGNPSVRSDISKQIRADQHLILPLALVVLVATLGLTLRRMQAVLIPVLTAGISVTWILGLMAALEIPVNVMTSIIPALLIIIGSTEDIHLLSEYQSAIHKRKRNLTAISLMAKHMGTAIALTFATTFLGFLSISLNRIDLLQQFGMMTAIGLAMNFLITITLVPASLQLMRRYNIDKPVRAQNLFESLSKWLHQKISIYPNYIISGIMLLMVICLFWATQIKVNNNIMDYFDPHSDIPEMASSLHENLSGMRTISIVLSGTEGTFLQVPYLEELRTLQEYLRDTERFDKSFSFADFIGVIHSGVDGEWPGTIYLPEQNAVVREYMTLLGHDSAKAFVSPDYSQAHILVRHDINSSHELNEVVASFKEYAREWIDPNLDIAVTGGSYLNSQAVDYMANGQARSLLLMLMVIFLIVSALFMNIKAGLIAVIANSLPIVVLFGVMGVTGIVLDTGTTMVGAIALGICVDHTMHFMVRYQRLAKNGLTEAEALSQVIQQESTPIIATAVALAAGFATLSFSDFPPVALFGVLSSVVMLLALVGTFIVIPLMLRNTRLISVWDVLSLRLRNEVIENCPLFEGMQPWQIRKLVVLSQIREYKPNEAVLMQGASSDTMFVMLEGQAEIWRTRGDGSTYQAGTYKAGEVFGITSLVSGRRRLADVVAINKVKLLAFRWSSIHRLARLYPRIASRFHQNLSVIIGKRLFKETMDSPYRDEQSGLYSSSYIHELLRFITDNAERHDDPLCLALLTVKGKDDIISNYGRQALWRVLHEVSQALTQELRKVDLLAHWHIGEFLLVLPRTGHDTIDKVIKRLNDALDKAEFGTVYEIYIQARWTCLRDDETADSLLTRTKKQPVMQTFGTL